MPAGGPDCVGGGRSVRGRPILELQQEALREFGVDAERQLAAGERPARGLERQSAAVLAVFFKWLAEQEMLKKVHAGTSKVST